MNDNHLVELLAGRYIATLATWNDDGSIHLSVVWFLHLDGAILIATSGTTRKVQNAARRREGSILIDTRGPADLRGAAATGSIEILAGETAQELNEQIWRKYLTAEGLAAPELGGAIRANDDVTIRFTPDRWRMWGTDKDFAGSFSLAGMSSPLDV